MPHAISAVGENNEEDLASAPPDGRDFQIATMAGNTVTETDAGFLIEAPTGASMKGTIL